VPQIGEEMEISSNVFVDHDNDKNLPIIPQVIYEELVKNFSIDYVLSSSDLKTNDEKIGYIRGVRDVLSRVATLANIEKE
jgi:hypothetical protein